ncbi:MAG: reverse transcriptase domain-containing protein, partial [Bryobacteraceae bacterium]
GRTHSRMEDSIRRIARGEEKGRPTMPVTNWLDSKWLRRAFTRVKENHGCAGVDGVTIAIMEARLDETLALLRARVDDGGYWAWPLRRIEVEKSPGSEERRRLLVPAVVDRVLQTAVAAYMEPFLEKEFEECSFAYRRGRSVRMAVERVYALYHQGYQWLLDADIDDFFDSVASELVLARLRPLIADERVIRLVQLWLDYTIWDGLRLVRPGLGLPQGSVVSPMLANLCLDTLDEKLLAADLKVVRYADDFVVLTKGRKAADRAFALTEETLKGLQLRLNEGKTRVVRFSDGFKFLGTIFLKDLLLQPWKPGRKRPRVLSSAGPLPESFFPDRERRPLRKYRGW